MKITFFKEDRLKAVFVHLSGSNRGKTEVFDSSEITIGTDVSNAMCFDPEIEKTTHEYHAVIQLRGCDYVLTDKGGMFGTLVNDQLVTEIALKDGDLIEFGVGGPRARFRIKTDDADVCKPWSQIFEDSIGIASEQHGGRITTATMFLRQLFWEVLTQTPGHFKWGIPAAVFILFVSFIAFFFFQYIRLSKTVEKVQLLEIERTVAENIIKKYNRGVCLIQGAFYFIDQETGEPLMMMGKGQRGINEYTGTGFLVGSDGLVLTNRHIAEPWWEINTMPYIQTDTPLKPKFELFRAFFPGIKEPFPLTVEKISDEVDMALLRIDTRKADIPVLELDTMESGAVVGAPILLMGYPAGVNAIFAKTDPEIVRQLFNMPFAPLVQELSNWGLIRPISTQGHLSDIMHNRIVYDAQTTAGGSGGPIFNNKGKVIGINYGIFPGFRGSNFGVPISYSNALIKSVKRPTSGKKDQK